VPEQISKYPEVTLKILKEAGAVCAEGAPQKILTACPPERFCSLPSGEVCIYGIADIPNMTQITPQELAKVVCPEDQKETHGAGGVSAAEGMALGVVFLAGLMLGRLWRTFGRRGRRPDSQ